MHLAPLASILALCTTQVAALGSITICKNALGRSVLDAQCRTFGPYTEPANCSGGCASASGKAVGALSENSRYCCELKTTYLGGDD